ncbi:MAG: phosphoribosylanthranilate isomerase [Thermohalobaculum sp.]|nr:phosphoribosylanthranilate isomerase [Thermohalobaculum sp.]
MTMRVKICGLSTVGGVAAAVAAGARYVGFVFFPPSPRSVGPGQARALALEVPPGIAKVGLFVDPDDAMLDTVLAEVPLDMIQLHGEETPARVAQVRRRTGLPVMKAVGISEAADLVLIDRYAAVADQLLIDAKPPRGAPLPGGNAVPFDWRLIAGRRWPLPWVLAGGLTPDNVAEAVRLTGARQVDVSSGVESAPGVKDAAKIRAFIAAASAAEAPPRLRDPA